MGHQMRLECRADGPTVPLVGLLQAPDHDVGIGDLVERKGLGVGECANCHLERPR